jgi:hypothetical protein
MRKQHAINPKVLVGEMGLNPPLLAIESNSDHQMQIKKSTETKMLPTTQCST